MSITKADINKIRRDREGVVNSSTFAGIKTLVSELYSEETHFIYELLQNAEDAKAEKVSFHLYEDRLVFMHNGSKQFDVKDVDAITSISASTKKDNYVQAGKFGIGFKSVYSFTNTPGIYCDSINFRIVSMMIPEIIEPMEEREKGWTVFEFPFDGDKIDAVTAFNRISKGLNDIDATSLLFLNNISEVTIYSNEVELYSLKRKKNDVIVEVESLSGNKKENVRKWLRYSKTIKLGDKPSEIDVAFEFRDSGELIFKPVRRGVFIKFVAKKERSGLNFYINAPFACTPSRESINEEDSANIRLIKELARLTTSSISDIQKRGMLNDSFFSTMPDIKNVPEIYYPIVETIVKHFMKHKLIPTVDGKYVSGENAVQKSENKIEACVSIELIKKLYGNAELQFVSAIRKSSDGYHFLSELVKRKVSADDIVIRISYKDESFIKDYMMGLSDVEIRNLYELFGYGIDSIVNSDMSDHGKEEILENFRKLAIVKTERNGFHTGNQVYMVAGDIEKPSQVVFVRNVLYRKSWAKIFLEYMGVRYFTEIELGKIQVESEQSGMIKFLNRVEKGCDISPNEVAATILNYIDENGDSGIDWTSYRFVWTGNTSDKKYLRSKLRRTNECYLDSPLIDETGFRFAENIHKKYAVSKIYNELDSQLFGKWIDFLSQNGVYYKFEVQCIRKDTGYSTGEDIDFVMPHLSEYFQVLQKRKILAINLWNELTNGAGWSSAYKNKIYRLNKNQDDKIEDSTVLKQLKGNKWVLAKNGRLYKPSEIRKEDLSDELDYNESNGFISAIELGSVIKEKEEKKLVKETKQLEVAKSLGLSNAQELIKARDTYKVVQELLNAGVDINEIYESIDSKRRVKETKSITTLFEEMRDVKFIRNKDEGDFEVAPIKNINRRSDKLRERMDCDEVVYKKKATLNSKKIISKEEKQFLNQEYEGKCQICNKVIIKKDGSKYFEAINILDTSQMRDSDLRGLSTGWNSLCLCPNHAAEYMYGAVSLYNFIEWVMSVEIEEGKDDFFFYKIKLQGKKTEIKFTPKHLLAIRVALEKLI